MDYTLSKCTLLEGHMLFEIGDIFPAVIKRTATIYFDSPSQVSKNWIYSVMRGFWQTVAVRLNIIPELGNLVNVGSCEVYVVDHMEPNSYLPKLTSCH